MAGQYTLIHTDTHQCYDGTMYRRLNITLPDDVVERADEFAQRNRYTRSALIVAALEDFMDWDSRTAGAEPPGAPGTMSHLAVLSPAVRSKVSEIIGLFRRRGVVYAAVVASPTRENRAIAPRNTTALVRLDPEHSHIKFLNALYTEFEILLEETAVLLDVDDPENRRRIREWEPLTVVLFDDQVSVAGAPDLEIPEAGEPDVEVLDGEPPS
jgi:hypothetical protein